MKPLDLVLSEKKHLHYYKLQLVFKNKAKLSNAFQFIDRILKVLFSGVIIFIVNSAMSAYMLSV